MRNFFIVMMVAALAAAGSVQGDVVWCYDFDETSGTTVHDLAGVGVPAFDGTIPDGSGFDENSVAGVHGTALNFPGNYYLTVDMTDAAALPGVGDSFTVSLWLKTSNWGQSGVAFAYVENGLYLTIGFGVTGTTPEIRIYSRDAASGNILNRVQCPVGGIDTNEWHHVAVVVTPLIGGGLDPVIYLDGVRRSLNHGTAAWTSNSTRIGARDYSSKRFYIGAMDDFAVIDSALTTSEVMAIYTSAQPVLETRQQLSYVASVIESGLDTMVMEGGFSDTIDVVLDSAPLANVTVTLDPNSELNLGLGSGVSKDLTFTSSNWNVPQTVTINAVDDSEVSMLSREGAEYVVLKRNKSIEFVISSSDPAFNGGMMAPTMFPVMIVDNDSPGVLIQESDGSTEVSEQGTTSDTYTVLLTYAPSADVVVTPADGADPAQVSISPASLTFSSANYGTAQTVTVTAIDDTTLEMDGSATVSHTMASDDVDYAAYIPDSVRVTIYDNECGAWAYDSIDVNEDCYVNLADFAILTAEWMNCSDPAGDCERYN